MLKSTLKPAPAPCHPTKALYAKGLCRSCYDKQLLANNPDYKERQLDNSRQWGIKNRERKRSSGRDYGKRKRTPEYNRLKSLKSWGLTLHDYEQMLFNQGGVCAICHKPPAKGKHLAIDHDHVTGSIRGLLHFRCNFGLSFFSENQEHLYRASQHVKQVVDIKSLDPSIDTAVLKLANRINGLGHALPSYWQSDFNPFTSISSIKNAVETYELTGESTCLTSALIDAACIIHMEEIRPDLDDLSKKVGTL